MDKTKWYEESPGVVSSKRIAGGVLLLIGVALKIALFFFAVGSSTLADGTLANSVTDGFFVAGCSLLGVTVLEGIGKKVGGGN